MKVYYSTEVLLRNLRLCGQNTISIEIDENSVLKIIPNNHNIPVIIQEPLQLVI